MKQIYKTILLIILSASSTYSQVITIGTGTSTNGTTSYPSPYGNRAYSAKHQMLIRASEMTAAGAVAGFINTVGFQVSNPWATTLTNFTIKMKFTTATTITTFQTGTNTVFTAPSYVPTPGFNAHSLTAPVWWNGTSNIIIETCFSNTSSSLSGNNVQHFYTSAGFSSVAYTYDWIVGGVCNSGSIASSWNRPNMQFSMSGCGLNTPVASFEASATNICNGQTVTFTNNTSCGTTYAWTFPGGSPATSTATNPVITYPTAGTYDVILTATNSFGSNTSTQTNYINVSTICPVVIGTGTSTNSTWSYPAPYGNYYYGAKHQMLIRASELTAAGASAGLISQLDFDVATPQGTPLQGFTIKMAQTALTTLTATFVSTGMTTVFSPMTYTEIAGWSPHPFSTPFYWNGTSNIIIETCFNNSSWTNNAQHRYTNAGFTSTSWRNEDALGVCNQAAAWGTSANRPNMRFLIGPCTTPPTASFSAAATSICVNGSVTFINNSICGTTYSWSFPGGSPATSTAANPVVTYATSGSYNVTLTATNSYGSNTSTQTNYVTVASTCPIIIGTGTSTMGNTSYPAPYGNWYWGAKHQMLILASELTGAGAVAGIISNMDFQVATAQGTPLQGFTIKMAQTSATSLTTTFASPGLTTVFNAVTYTEVAGWSPHVLNTPFYWDGTSNLLIETCFNNSSFTYNAVHYYTPTSFNSVTWFRQDAAGVCGQSTGTTSVNRPNMRFTIAPCSSPPVANFTVSTTSTCVGQTVSFTNTSACGTSFSWTFPGGTPSTSTIANPSVTYSTAGTYDVVLTATNSFGSNTSTQTGFMTVVSVCPVTVGTGTLTNFYYSYPCIYGNYAWGAKHQILIRATEITASGGSAGMISQIGWQVQSPVGTPLLGFNIKAKTTTATAVTTSFVSGLQQVLNPTTYTETAGWNMHTLDVPFYWNGTDNVIIEACFNNSSSTNNSIMMFTNMGYNATTYRTGYTTGICNMGTGTTSTRRPNTRFLILPCSAPPVAGFSASTTTGCVGGTITFFDDLSQCPTSWLWSFPGGTPSTSTAQDPTVSYPTTGVFDVTLTVTNAYGSDTYTVNNYVTINPYCPVIIGTGTSVNSQYGYPAPYGNYYWGAKHQMLILGSEITAAGGVSGLLKGIGFSVASQAGIPLTDWTIRYKTTTSTSLTTTFETGLTTAFGPVTYAESAGLNMHVLPTPIYWNGSDNIIIETCFNNTSWIANAQHYFTPTSFTSVSWINQDAAGVCGQATGYSTSVNRPNIILDLEPCTGPPIAAFNSTTTTICSGSSVTFNDVSQCFPTGRTWIFPGGTPSTSTATNPTVSYFPPPTDSTYDVTLISTNGSGSDTLTLTNYITVQGAPIADFVGSPLSVIVGGSVSFTDLSQCTPTSWAWTFSGGTPSTSTAQNPSGIIYNTAGVYAVSLTASNASGSNTRTRLAYITVTDNLVATATTVSNFISQLTGPGVIISNTTTTCATNAMGLFSGGGTGITDGVLMTTGSIFNAQGPNNSTSLGTANYFAGDPELDVTASPNMTYDGCIVEFDLIPTCDSLTITFVFGSEEYTEYAYTGSPYEDVFGFYVAPPLLPLGANFATVPGTADPITVQTVNQTLNNQYFVFNTGNNIQYDGYTTIIRSGNSLVPLLQYHVKLAIADGADYIYDTGILIKKNSLESISNNVVCSVTALPVELVTFTAWSETVTNEVQWVTASEVNNDYFILEKSSDAQAFYSYKRIEGNGNTTSTLTYNVTDREPYNGVTYYRLRQVDFDGSARYSEIIAVSNSNALSFSLDVYPNPATEYVNLIVSSNKKQQVRVVFSNYLGMPVFDKIYRVNNGKTFINVELDDLAQGIYYISIADVTGGNNERFKTNSTKFVKY